MVEGSLCLSSLGISPETAVCEAAPPVALCGRVTCMMALGS